MKATIPKMKINPLHDWNLSPKEAVELQKQFAYEVVREDDFEQPIKTVAGLDLGHSPVTNMSRAAVVVLSFPELLPVESVEAEIPTAFPYVPGLLSFRETPVAIKALEKLKTTPDLIMVDGQGYAHPRRFGVACHVGLISGIPSIGVAKSVLVGRYDELGFERGSTTELVHKNEVIGMVVRTRDKVQPLFVSIGNRISLETATELVLKCCTNYRLPEPTRLADKMSSYRKR